MAAIFRWSASSLRRQIAMVPQQTILFNDSILGNIRFGLRVSRQRVEEAARAACADEFIEPLAERLRHEAGRTGVRAVRGAEAATGDRESAAAKPEDTPARRADQPDRSGLRIQDPSRIAETIGRDDRHSDRPPPEHDRTRRRGGARWTSGRIVDVAGRPALRALER